MKVVTVKEDNLNSPIEDCFGKTKFFCFIKDDINNIEFVSNPGNDFLKNSGKKAVTFLHSRGVTSVMSGNYGMTVKKMFDKHKIQTIIIPAKYKNLTQLLKILK
ncbi:MAG: NifB/NifX family molybdenum-iron cluster-binding protein [Candidatus Kapaibacterium sp.]